MSVTQHRAEIHRIIFRGSDGKAQPGPFFYRCLCGYESQRFPSEYAAKIDMEDHVVSITRGES